MSPRIILSLTLALFAVAVVCLSTNGKQWLHALEQTDATVSYLDLARQATQKRAYTEADAYYKQAIDYAEKTAHPEENLAVALADYSAFLRKKRNPLKDLNLAQKLDQKAQALRQKTY